MKQKRFSIIIELLFFRKRAFIFYERSDTTMEIFVNVRVF